MIKHWERLLFTSWQHCAKGSLPKKNASINVLSDQTNKGNCTGAAYMSLICGPQIRLQFEEHKITNKKAQLD